MTENTRGVEYTTEEMKEKIRETAIDRIGPTKSYFNNYFDRTPTASTVAERFDGWNNAIREADVIPTHQPTRKEMISQLLHLSDGETPPTRDEFISHPRTVSRVTIRDRFGDYTNFVTTAGLEPRENHRQPDYSKEDIIQQISRLADGTDAPSQTVFGDNPETASVTTVRRYFGSYNQAVREAGYEPNPPEQKGLADEDVLEQIKNESEDGVAPTSKEFRSKSDTVSIDTVIDRFGSWNAAVEAAGVERNTRGVDEIPRHEIMDHIERLWVDDTPPTADDFRSDEKTPSVATVQRRFGSWNEAVKSTMQERNVK